MTPDLIALARAIVALPGWTWEAGVVALGSGRVVAMFSDGSAFIGGRKIPPEEMAIYHPDLLDAATGGVLLDRLGPDYGVERYSADQWCVFSAELDGDAQGPSLASACARAMVARGRA